MLVLSPFLYMGVISEYVNREGNIPVDRVLLHIYANGDDINGALVFINLAVIPSYLHFCLTLSWLGVYAQGQLRFFFFVSCFLLLVG
jgi:hypothetical protein